MRLRELWIWDRDEASFYSKQIVGSCLHVCSGRSSIGDVRIDLYERADIKADYRHLPIRDKSFDTVICDPYWGKKERVDKGIMQWLDELRRIARKRIIIVHNTIFTIRGWRIVRAWAVNTGKGLFWKVCVVYAPEGRLEDFICS